MYNYRNMNLFTVSREEREEVRRYINKYGKQHKESWLEVVDWFADDFGQLPAIPEWQLRASTYPHIEFPGYIIDAQRLFPSWIDHDFRNKLEIGIEKYVTGWKPPLVFGPSVGIYHSPARDDEQSMVVNQKGELIVIFRKVVPMVNCPVCKHNYAPQLESHFGTAA